MARPDIRACHRRFLRGIIDDALDLATVDAEFACDGPLAVTGFVPGSYRQFHARCFGQGMWYGVVRYRQGVVRLARVRRRGDGSALRSDEGHQEFE